MKKVSISSPTSSKTLAAGSASIAALFTASAANATIIYFNTPITSDDSTEGSVYWNIDGEGDNEAIFINDTFLSTTDSTYSYKSLRNIANDFAVVGSSSLFGLAASQSINGGRSFDNNFYVFFSGSFDSVDNFTSGASTYIGFRFNPSGTMLYGWANVTLTEGNQFGTFVINEWAYDDTGASIQTGATSAVPEPATYAAGLGLLALGAAGLRRWRKQKNAA